jgi:ubiquinone/menaquinone biosynthesis C-methylase UbiE
MENNFNIDETLKPSRKVLEIGAGSGGVYKKEEKGKKDQEQGIARFFIDINKMSLWLNQASRKSTEQDSFQTDATKTLPFKEASFDEIVINFPSGTLMDALMEQESLWEELGRIMAANGRMVMVMEDVYKFKQTEKSPVKRIIDPQKNVDEMARKLGFKVQIESMSAQEVRDLDTFSAVRAASMLENKDGINAVNRLLITKTTP